MLVVAEENTRFRDKLPGMTLSKVEFLELASSLSPTEFLGLSDTFTSAYTTVKLCEDMIFIPHSKLFPKSKECSGSKHNCWSTTKHKDFCNRKEKKHGWFQYSRVGYHT